MTIGPFRGDYRFLSNFWLEPRRRMLSQEHFFQSAKTLDIAERGLIMRSATPGEAKRLGRNVVLRPDWEAVKETVMLEGLRTKFFSDETLADMLLSTGEEELVEINTWGDVYWGVNSQGNGQNRLGVLLMRVRDELEVYRG
jgi:ribA/ribD-fused uncharacterized protein